MAYAFKNPIEDLVSTVFASVHCVYACLALNGGVPLNLWLILREHHSCFPLQERHQPHPPPADICQEDILQC